jgi:hypothetical protein
MTAPAPFPDPEGEAAWIDINNPSSLSCIKEGLTPEEADAEADMDWDTDLEAEDEAEAEEAEEEEEAVLLVSLVHVLLSI